jgi:hypothetical protein
MNRLPMPALFLPLLWAAVPASVRAQAEEGLTVGAVVWRHETDLDVEQAISFDGEDVTAEQAARDWSFRDSGMGLRVAYALPTFVTLAGEVGIAQPVLRVIDTPDPDRDVGSVTFDSGFYVLLSPGLEGSFATAGNVFWAADLTFRLVSTDVDLDSDTNWDHDETSLAVSGKLGLEQGAFGFYGGVRFTSFNLDVDIRDRTPSGTVRSGIEFDRRDVVDLLLGARTKGSHVAGFFEVGLVGTLSGTVGLSLVL